MFGPQGPNFFFNAKYYQAVIWLNFNYFYRVEHNIEKILKDKNVELSRLAVGLPVGSNLEYIDDKTISSAISGRVKLS